MAKLPKWAIRQAGGINKKAWQLARRGRTNKRKATRRPPPKRRTYAKRTTTNRRVNRTRKPKFVTKPLIDGLISGGGKIVMRKVLGSHPIYEAAFDIGLGYFRNNKTLMGQGIINGATALLPSMNILGGQGQEPFGGQ